MHLISAGKLKEAAIAYSDAVEIVKNFAKKSSFLTGRTSSKYKQTIDLLKPLVILPFLTSKEIGIA